MILYSIIPPERVFEGYVESNINECSELIEMEYKGEKVIATAMGNGDYVIKRLISTSPKSYLNPELQPGTIIRP